MRQAPEGWVLYRQDGGRDFFDPQGRLLRRETAEGQITRLTRDATSGRLTRIEDPAGRALTLDYDPASGHLRAVIDPAGERIAYTYDAAHRLTQVDYPDAHSRRYHYEDPRFPHALTGITDETGTRFSTYTYDAAGRAATSEHVGGVERITLNYSTASGGVTTTVSDGLNQQRIYTYAYPPNSPITITRQCPDCGSGLTRSYSYYSDNLPASLRNERGITTTYSYDLTRYLETSRTEASGTPQARTLTTQWHPTFRRPARITAPNQRTDFTYNAQGQVLTRTETALDTGAARTWSYTYDASGRLTQSDGPRTDINDLTTYRYDNSGDLIQITNALGHVTQITQRDAHGRPLTVVDPNGVTTTLAYDPRGRLVRHTVADATTTYHYDAAGITRLTLPDGATLNYTYDAAHRLTELSDALGHRLTYTLDVQGNRTQETLHDPNGVLTHTRARAYNSLNRLIQDIDAAGNRTTYAYDATGNLTRTTDALNRTTDTGYDALDRLIQVTDPNRGLTRYHYDAQSHLTGITDPKGLATTYTPDGLGQRVRQTSPDTGLATTTYDAAGNRLTQTDARGVTTTYRYDALNRPVSLSYPDHRLNITFTYDEGIYGIGRLTGMNDGSGSTRYTYTARGQRLSETRTQDSHTFTTAYTYDAADRLIQITYPSGRTVHYARDDAGRIRAVRTQQGGPATVLAETLAYLPFGPMQSLTYGNGLTLTRTFDQNYRLTAQTLGAIQNVTYRYDAVGHLTQIIPADPSRHQTFGYDALDRLTAAQGIYGHLTYTYDPVGNRLTQTRNGQTDTYAYPAASHRLTGISGPQARSYTYDAAGNATQAGGLQLHYGDHNRLTRLTAAAATADYRYDGHGQRVAKTLNGQTTSFHYDPAGHLIAESNAQGLPLREYVYLDDLPLALFTSGQTYFIHPDHLGTPQWLTDAAQQVAWSADYQPFGELARTSAAVDHPLRFPGQYYDEESGLHYNYFRDYDPNTGRYIQSDPIGLVGGINTYAYVGGNPLRYVDPWGLEFVVAGRGTANLYSDDGQLISSYGYTSGVGGSTDPTARNKGPLPPGQYVFDPSEISEGGFFRSLLGDWGKYRVPLKPIPGTNTFGRDGFFMHGGKKPGSLGCIDLGSGDEDFFSRVRNLKDPVDVFMGLP